MTRLSYEDVGITEPDEGVIEFEITKEHLQLLRAMQISWNDLSGYGSAQTHPDRPYGTRDVENDVRRILNNEALTYEEVMTLHRGAAMALQIALKTGKFKASTFYAQKFGQDWKERGKKKTPKEAGTDDEPTEGQIPLEAVEA